MDELISQSIDGLDERRFSILNQTLCEISTQCLLMLFNEALTTTLSESPFGCKLIDLSVLALTVLV